LTHTVCITVSFTVKLVNLVLLFFVFIVLLLPDVLCLVNKDFQKNYQPIVMDA